MPSVRFVRLALDNGKCVRSFHANPSKLGNKVSFVSSIGKVNRCRLAIYPRIVVATALQRVEGQWVIIIKT